MPTRSAPHACSRSMRRPLRGSAASDRGMAAVAIALYGEARRPPATAFFRFPGFAASPALLARLERRGIVVFGADLWASDWNPMTADREVRLMLDRLELTGGGIV